MPGHSFACTVSALLALLLGIGPAFAATPTTRPATGKAAAAATTKQAQAELPSPASLAATLKKMREEKAAVAKVAHIDLSRQIVERPADFALFADTGAPTHYSVVRRLRDAAADSSLSGVLVTLGSGEVEMAQAMEIRDALAAVTATGKPTFVYADRYSTSGYLLATGAQNICLLPGGEMLMPGVSVEVMFARGLLDKVGVQADLVQIGEYKGAAEAFTRTAASDELRGELNRLVDSLYGLVVREIAARRRLDPKVVQAAIDRAMLPASAAKEMGLVDQVIDIDALREVMARKIGRPVEIVRGYGQEKRDEIDLSSPFAVFQLLSRRPQASDEPAVALVYVDGMIVEGEGGEGLLSDSVASEGAVRKAMRIIARDPDIKAAVIRINSPGGSALASEAAWQAIRRVAKDKPVVVSIGGMAASGGYYIACAGDRIYADPSAVIGSIGVVGGKVSLAGLYQKLGVTTEIFARGANAGMFNSAAPFTDNQRAMLNNLMRQTYDQFVDRVMQTRKGRIAEIDKVARGRIFIGETAVKLGLADEIGGVDKALAYAADKGGLGKGFKVRVLPAPKSLADLLSGDGETAAGPVPSMQSQLLPRELAILPPAVRRLTLYNIAAIQEMNRTPVLLLPPAIFQVR